MTETPKQINVAHYTGLAEAYIRRYNNSVKDLAREIRLGRGDDEYACQLVNNEIPEVLASTLKEMAGQDFRRGRKTDPANMGT